jgi:hypothetical protein
MNNTVVGNKGHGIRGNHSNRITGNLCANNGQGIPTGGAGIMLEQVRNHVEGNTVVQCGLGYGANQALNTLVRNTASGCGTNWFLASGNKVGPIVSPPDSGFISGSTGGAGMGTTDPWANISY